MGEAHTGEDRPGKARAAESQAVGNPAAGTRAIDDPAGASPAGADRPGDPRGGDGRAAQPRSAEARAAEGRAADPLGLAQAVCTRLCHDLGGPVGALTGALELLDDATDDAAEVARDAARIIDRRLRFWRVAVGGASGDLDAAGLAQLVEGLTLGRRATVDLGGLAAGGLVTPEFAQPLLLAMLVGVEALPRGGTLRVAGTPEGSVSVWPDGPSAAWPPGLPALVAGQAPVLTPRSVALPLLAATAAAGRVRLDLALGGTSPAPLLLTRQGAG